MYSSVHEKNAALDFQVFNQSVLIEVFNDYNKTINNRDVTTVLTDDDLTFKAAIKWYKFKQTDIFKREILIPSSIVILILGAITAKYYYTLCTDNSWHHVIEMTAPALLALLIGVLGTLGCIRGYAYADYYFAKQKLV